MEPEDYSLVNGTKAVGVGMVATIQPENDGFYIATYNAEEVARIKATKLPYPWGVKVLIESGKLTEEQIKFVRNPDNWKPTIHDLFDPEADK